MRTLLFTCGLLAFVHLPGQDTTLTFPERKNLVKLGLSSGFVSIISLNYERVFNDRISAAMTVSWMVPRRPEGLLDLHTDNLDLSSGRELTGWYFTPEVKWYLEKNDVRPAPRGFYIGAYLRYSDTRLTSHMSGVTDSSGTVEGDLQVDLMEAGLGFSAGYQLLMIHDRVAIDFVFFGPRYSLYSVKVDAELNGDGQLLDDLSQALEDAIGREVMPFDIELEKSGTTRVDHGGLGYRFGFKIGYAF
ncbi:MAG TPA: hypothetical protein VKG92_00480 [Flavobacteriales bacterium]|nr:hypothetical protein [Flavobacteriales bacterium]